MRARYRGLDEVWNGRAAQLNERLRAANLPVQVANLSSIWTLQYTRPSRYNWMFQYYLRAEGLALSWVGTGRLIYSLDYSDADFAHVADRIVAAAAAMDGDGWWWQSAALTNRAIKSRVFREILRARGLFHASGRSARPSAGTAAPSSRA
jgi:glutamate-1-semialdehyde 2,1-aminomutase